MRRRALRKNHLERKCADFKRWLRDKDGSAIGETESRLTVDEGPFT